MKVLPRLIFPTEARIFILLINLKAEGLKGISQDPVYYILTKNDEILPQNLNL